MAIPPPGQPLGGSSAGGHQVDVDALVVISGEGDPLPVGGELRGELHPGVGGDSKGGRAVQAGCPEVTLVGEDQPVAPDIGVLDETGLLGGEGEKGHQQQGEKDNLCFHRASKPRVVGL